MSLGTSLQAARKAKGLGRDALAKIMGVSRQTVDNWEKDKHRPTQKQIPKLTKALGLQPSDFNIYGSGGVMPADPKKRPALVPLIDWTDLQFIRAGKLNMAGIRRSRLIEASPDISPEAVALEVIDNSMEPTFRIGERIFICPADPGHLQEDDCVVARLDSGEHVLRHIVPRRSGAYDLVAENPDYRTLTVNAATHAEIVGVVVEHHRRLKVQ
mgnify:CR=1 FL=1